MKPFLSHLECGNCGHDHPADRLQTVCDVCGGPLLVRYRLDHEDMPTLHEILDRRPGQFRFPEVLPTEAGSSTPTLGEGATPMVRAARFGSDVWVKDEAQNPTGSFKARGMALAIARNVELGATEFCLPSAGNDGGAAAAYGARAGMEVKVFMPKDAPEANKKETLVAGSELNLVEGLINDAGRVAVAVAKELGLFDLSTLKEPYRAEGKKSMGLEMVQQLGWKMPDAVIYPTGGGTGIIGMYKGFKELLELGWIEGKQPKFISVQADGCQPIVKAFHDGASVSEPWANATTKADGLRVPHPFADYLILEAIRATGGTALAVSDQEMIDAMYEMAGAEGIFPAPEGAATLVGLKRLLDQKFLDPDESVVLFNTGSGYKYLDLISGSPRN